MIIVYSKSFKKQFKKLRSGEKNKFEKRVSIFIQNTQDQQLNDHALHGELSYCRSFNITGDLRVYYEQVEEDVVLFTNIDTRSNLYS